MDTTHPPFHSNLKGIQQLRQYWMQWTCVLSEREKIRILEQEKICQAKCLIKYKAFLKNEGNITSAPPAAENQAMVVVALMSDDNLLDGVTLRFRYKYDPLDTEWYTQWISC